MADGGDADGLAERRRGDSQVRCNVEAGPDDDFGPLKVPVDARIAQKLDTPHGLQDVARRLIQLRRIVARQHDRDITAGAAALRLEADPRDRTSTRLNSRP